MSELVERETTEVVPINTAASMIAVIERAAMNHEVDVEKMERLFALQEKMLAKDSVSQFNADLAAAQAELPMINKDGAIVVKGQLRSKYATFESINETVKPILSKYGFAVMFKVNINGLVRVTATLVHRAGHSEETSMDLPVDMSGSKNNVQALGSSTAYGKRYTMCALLNISTGDAPDDDGQAADTSPFGAALSAIRSSQNIQQLQDQFKRAWVGFPDQHSRKVLTGVKDEMKKTFGA